MTLLVAKKKELKPEQATAARTLDRHVSVTAGPGAGKTTVLVERYLHILREHKDISIDQIVAITFTNRAANEMRERLRVRLDQLLNTASPAARIRWMRYKRTLDGAIITTIHGFCARLLREFPVEARIDPQFTLLDEHQAAIILEAAVEEALTEFINSGHEAISRLTVGVGRGRLAAALVELYRTVRGQGPSIPQLAKQTAASQSTWDQYLSEFVRVDSLIRELISLRGLSDKVEEKRYQAERNWPRVRQLLLDEKLPLGDYCRELAEFREVARPNATGKIAELVKQLDELLWSDKREKPFGEIPRLRFDLLAREYACELIKVLTSVGRRLEEKKQQLSALDFDDLQLRTLQLLDRREVRLRAARRYKFFLVDEFQDTNGLQRDLLDQLALKSRNDANLFIVGDRKQSIYGFRGADVDVFRDMTEALMAAGGTSQALHLNFRSQPPLIDFFNLLFERLFRPGQDINQEGLNQLGFVEHERSVAEREKGEPPPLVELMVDTGLGGDESDPNRQRTSRERDAKQLAWRIISLVETSSAAAAGSPAAPRLMDNISPTGDGHVPAIQYRDIALLFRAMTDVPAYESVFRRANIPYQTVLGKGFYEREEIADLIQLLRFLDNRSDELALAAVLRSPLCGISDNALLSLRLAPLSGETQPGAAPLARRRPRKLFKALRQQREIDFITAEEHGALDHARTFLGRLIEKRNRYPIAELLRLAVETSQYTAVISANFDAPQRLANVQKLFDLAERFERAGAHLIRDFVQYVRDFEAIGSRESEGQIDESANAVTLMTIHQAKGLEFPVVILPDLHRLSGPKDNWLLLDRHLGLTLKVPNGRGDQVAGSTFKRFSERAASRDQFESMRLLYVAATRARDRLILSGVTDELSKLNKGRDCWLKWIWQALELPSGFASDLVDLGQNVQLRITLNLLEQQEGEPVARISSDSSAAPEDIVFARQPANYFPLMQPIGPQLDRAIHRFSVTQLINYQRCPRQYYFDRVLHAPTADQTAVWNNAEAPEPPANLTATLKGAVIHRFCETYLDGDNPDERLRASLEDVIRSRQAELADRLDLNAEEALNDLLPLARNYLSSDVFRRIELARKLGKFPAGLPSNAAGLWSELSFRLRRPLGILTGMIDKLLISPSQNGDGFDVEIIDFKTNRFGSRRPSPVTGTSAPLETLRSRQPIGEAASHSPARGEIRATWHPSAVTPLETQHHSPSPSTAAQQFVFDFSQTDALSTNEVALVQPRPLSVDLTAGIGKRSAPSFENEIRLAASDYRLQMQAYALAVRELMPRLANSGGMIKVTLHFLQPNVECNLTDDLLDPTLCAQAIDEAMLQIISSAEPEQFPVRPASHCRMCNFLEFCSAGRQWVSITHSK